MTSPTAPPAHPSVSDQIASRLMGHRILVLDSELDEAIGMRLCSQLFLLSADDPHSDISLWIDSPGGSVPAMLAVADTIALIPNDVSTLALGVAASAGQFLLSAGTKEKRYALPHARILMHQGSAGIAGSAVEIETQAADLRHTRDTVLGLIADFTGQTPEKIHEDSQHDRWYTAEQARDYGFVDRVLTSLQELRPGRPRTGFGAGEEGSRS